MFVVKIENWPKGSEADARQIGEILIVPRDTTPGAIGDYRVTVMVPQEKKRMEGIFRKAEVERFNSRQGDIYDLVLAALQAAIGKPALASVA